MIRVKIELWPLGDKTKARSLGSMEIALDPKTLLTPKVGSYNYRILQWGKDRKTWKKGHVGNHDRMHRGPWDLLYRCLVDAVASRNKETP